LVTGLSNLPRELAEPAYEVAEVITLEALLESGLAVATVATETSETCLPICALVIVMGLADEVIE
jgi:hypothetical protein